MKPAIPSPITFMVAFWLVTFAPPAKAADNIELAGTVLEIALPTFAGGLTMYFRDWKGTLQFGESAVVSSGTTQILKITINERRPNGGNYSFPSGHTSISFCSAEFLRKRYGWKYGIPVYALAAFVGYSRIESRNHYFHDVVAGAAIGFLSSWIFTKPYNKGIKIETVAHGKWYGLKITGNFNQNFALGL